MTGRPSPSTPVTPFLDWPAGLSLTLASRSPRRAELLRLAGIPFTVEEPGDVETELGARLAAAGAAPPDYAVALARAKAAEVAGRAPERLVLGADTIVVLDGDILEKPRDRADAVGLLGRLAGRRHTVITAIALAGGPVAGAAPGLTAACEWTAVEFLPLSPAAIERYVETGEPMDKAGAYGIQGYGALMVRRVEGCYFNVMGLPLARLGVLLDAALRARREGGLMSALPFPFPVVGWREDRVVVLDQTRLPAEVVMRDCADVAALCAAIRELAVRGAPAIGVAAGYGLALAARRAVDAGHDTAGVLAAIGRARDELAATRPTAVNLFWALDRVTGVAAARAATGASAAALAGALLAEARAIGDQDVARCRRLGEAGAALLPDGATVLTHCNAGGLATGGYGTALGVIYAARDAGKTIRVFADETRPLLQGARLTAWELADQGIEVTVICDGAAASVLRRGLIDAVITGADRIAANGDAANKIGTYPLAVLADRHEVPFYVAAPASTFDAATPDGTGIEIEQRDPDEVHSWQGRRVTPAGVRAWNPAFDVTPAELITAFITERGVLRPPFDRSLGVLATA